MAHIEHIVPVGEMKAMARGRPKAADPKVQRNIYPPTSMWDRIAARAGDRPIGEVAVELMGRGLAAAEAADKRKATSNADA